MSLNSTKANQSAFLYFKKKKKKSFDPGHFKAKINLTFIPNIITPQSKSC